MNLNTKNIKLLFVSMVLSMSVTLPVLATDTSQVTNGQQVNYLPWRMDPKVMTSISDPHPFDLTSHPQTMSGSEADTQFGRNLPSGSSQVGLRDDTVSSGVGDFQNVINRITSVATPTARINQLQTQISQNQSQVGYTFENKFSISSMTDSSGNIIGQASGNFIQTRQDLVSGTVQTTTCTGTFTWEPVNGVPNGRYTLTTGTAHGTGAGCTPQ